MIVSAFLIICFTYSTPLIYIKNTWSHILCDENIHYNCTALQEWLWSVL